MGNFAIADLTRFVNQLQEAVDTRRRHPEAERRARQRFGAKPARGFLSSMLRSPGATRTQRIQAVRLERRARRRVQEGNTHARRGGRTRQEGTGARPGRRVGSRRTARVAAPPGGDDAGGSGSEPPAEPAQNARPFRSAFQKLGFPLLNRSFSSPLRDPGALMAFALLLARWSR
jgi:hypothetical protein